MRLLPPDEYNHSVWEAKLIHLYWPTDNGELRRRKKILLVARPAPELVSVNLAIGKNYRIFCRDFYRHEMMVKKINRSKSIFDLSIRELCAGEGLVGKFSQKLSIWNGSVLELPCSIK